MMFFDPDFLHRRLAGKGLEPLSHAADPRRKPTLSNPTQPSRSRIAVPLFSKPADYVPGSGPPLRPISLLPAGDSTAYIIERVLLPSPGPAPSGKPLPKRMAYLIGWRDLRAASMVVPAMQVLEYVSPRTLEEFEAKLEQEVDDEKEKLRNEFKSGLTMPQQKKKKKRGRPPAHSQIKSAVVAEPVVETTPTKPRHKKGVISLSTPQKSRLADFEWLSEDDASPSRQIAEEQFQSLHGFLPGPEEGSNVAGDTNDPLAIRDLAHPVRGAPQTSLDHIAGSDPAKQQQPSASPNLEFARIKTPVSTDGGVQISTTSNKHSLPPVALSVDESNWSNQPLDLPPSSSAPPVVQTVQAVQKQAEAQNPAISLGEGAKVDQKPKQSKKRLRSEDEGAKTEVQEDNGWVVERIEDVEYYEVDGIGLVRYFRVSWEGDWPPDQKRTWEPEENIPANLVRNFFKNSRHKRKALSRLGTVVQSHSQSHPKEKGRPAKRSGSSSLKQGTLSWPAVRRKYKSVSEAFAAEDYDGPEMMDDDGYEAEEEDVGGSGPNEYFVVTEDGDDDLHGQSLWPSAGALSSAFGVLGGLQ